MVVDREHLLKVQNHRDPGICEGEMGHSVIENLGKGLRAICGAGVDSIQEAEKAASVSGV